MKYISLLLRKEGFWLMVLLTYEWADKKNLWNLLLGEIGWQVCAIEKVIFKKMYC